jgi:hypothetical protein
LYKLGPNDISRQFSLSTKVAKILMDLHEGLLKAILVSIPLLKKYWHHVIGGPHFMKTLLKCTKLVTFANDLGQYGEVARFHSYL